MRMNKEQRFPITVRINKKAWKRLHNWSKRLLDKHAGSPTRQFSEGKIVETLLLKEDARQYVEEQLNE